VGYPSVTALVVPGIGVSITVMGWSQLLLEGLYAHGVSFPIDIELNISRSPAISSCALSWSGMCDVPCPNTRSFRINADILEMKWIVTTCVGLERQPHLSWRYTTGFWQDGGCRHIAGSDDVDVMRYGGNDTVEQCRDHSR
jgi:hypothetical protein